MTYIDIWDDSLVYKQWSKGAGGPFALWSQYVWGMDPLGDAQYLFADTPGQAITFPIYAFEATAWPRAHNFNTVKIVAWVRTAVASSTCRFKILYMGQEYNSEPYVVTSATYTEISWVLTAMPDGSSISTSRLWFRYTDFEVGLEFLAGDELRCTKLHLYPAESPYPHWTMVATAAGTQANWLAYPGAAAPWTTLQRYDGDESYCYSTVGGDISVFPHDPMGPPFPTEIDNVKVVALVKNMSATAQTVTPLLRIAGVDYRGGCDTLGTVVAPDGAWHLIWAEYSTDPSLAWPAGNPAGGPWTQAQVNAAEIGFENTSGGDIRVTSLALEVSLVPAGSTVIDWFPTANGFHQDFPPVAPNVGEAAWEDVDEDPPDDAVSYIEASATVVGTPQYCSFTVGGAGAPGANERIYLVELTARIRLGNLPHSTAEVVPVLRDTTAGLAGCPFFGKPIVVEGTGGTWFDVKWLYYNTPLEGRWVWGAGDWTDPAVYEFGVGVVQGDLLVSRIRARIITCPDYPAAGAPDPIDLQLTNIATFYMNRSIGDGTMYAVTEFAVGTGGYDVTAPGSITVINPADLALTSEIWRGPLTHMVYTAAAPPWEVQYWCRTPRSVAQYGIGEVGLFAEILWSPFPWEIGTKFLFAIQHMPLQSRHVDMVGLYVLTVFYP